MKDAPKLLLAGSSVLLVERLAKNLPAAVLLAGEKGVGLATIARAIARNYEDILKPHDAKGEYDSSTGIISVDDIRNLYVYTRSAPRQQTAIIIDDADKMTVQAQQAFLKLLEEPPRNISFVLTSHQPNALLSTIRSRVQTYILPRISTAASREYLAAHKLDDDTITKLLFIADGRPSLLAALTEDKNKREQTVRLVGDAKVYISAGRMERIAIALKYQSRGDAITLLDASLQLMRFSLGRRPSAATRTTTKNILAAMRAIENGGNVRLHLLSGVL